MGHFDKDNAFIYREWSPSEKSVVAVTDKPGLKAEDALNKLTVLASQSLEPELILRFYASKTGMNGGPVRMLLMHNLAHGSSTGFAAGLKELVGCSVWSLVNGNLSLPTQTRSPLAQQLSRQIGNR